MKQVFIYVKTRQSKLCETQKPYVGLGGSVKVMGECSVSQWILGVIRFQKIFGLYSVERLKVEK